MNEIDEGLREWVRSIERDGGSCAVTLILRSAIRCGRLVPRSVYWEAFEEYARKTSRTGLVTFAREQARRTEEVRSHLHLVESRLISGGQTLPCKLTSEDGESVVTMNPPARVRLRAVEDWQLGSPFEDAIER